MFRVWVAKGPVTVTPEGNVCLDGILVLSPTNAAHTYTGWVLNKATISVAENKGLCESLAGTYALLCKHSEATRDFGTFPSVLVREVRVL